jgi:hypothetical protein
MGNLLHIILLKLYLNKIILFNNSIFNENSEIIDILTKISINSKIFKYPYECKYFNDKNELELMQIKLDFFFEQLNSNARILNDIDVSCNLILRDKIEGLKLTEDEFRHMIMSKFANINFQYKLILKNVLNLNENFHLNLDITKLEKIIKKVEE